MTFEQVEMFGCQRWRERRDSYRPLAEPINPSEFGVELIEERQAKAFVAKHHYAGSLPPCRVRVGLMRSAAFQRAELVGVAVFSVPVQAKAIPRYFQVGQDEGVELGRLCLLDSVGGNGESWFVTRACKLLHQELPHIKAVLSYSDPLERTDASGRLVKRGHAGSVYRSLSASFLGRSSARTLFLDAAGRVVSERTLCKLRNDESGAAGAYRMLIEAGAPRMKPGEAPAEYVTRALAEGPFRRMRHPGNLAFGWGCGGKAARKETRARMQPMPYPSYESLGLETQRPAMV